MATAHETPEGVTRYRCVSLLDKARGVIGREPGPGEEFSFEFGRVKKRSVHMVGVRKPLEVEFRTRWDGRYRVETKTVLQPWTGVASAKCNWIIERGIEP